MQLRLKQFVCTNQTFYDVLCLQEIKDLETGSAVSSRAGSARGRPAENGPSMDLSNNQAQVEVIT